MYYTTNNQRKCCMGNFQVETIILWIVAAITVIVVGVMVALIINIKLKSPFHYPYKVIKFDVSGMRAPNINDLIDKYLIKNGLKEIDFHCKYVEKWKKECLLMIEKSKLKKRREKQYLECIDDSNMFRFKLVRGQTRYQQVNYVRTPYKVENVVDSFSTNCSYLIDRYKKLQSIGLECTISEYNSKDQRKRMTKALREEIAVRDNYTCQICGKYMPDGVGLHIDHIVPISKGGKSIPSNLQVLCSKCNGKKSDN